MIQVPALIGKTSTHRLNIATHTGLKRCDEKVIKMRQALIQDLTFADLCILGELLQSGDSGEGGGLMNGDFTITPSRYQDQTMMVCLICTFRPGKY